MKKFLLVCLLGLGLLLPTTTITAKEHLSKRVIDVTMENNVYLVHSGTEDGIIKYVAIKTVPNGLTVLSQECGDYTCSLDVSKLPAGSYVIQVFAANRTYEKQFKKAGY